jgi:hypothetical protein
MRKHSAGDNNQKNQRFGADTTAGKKKPAAV